MTHDEFIAEIGRMFEQESSPTYVGSSVKGLSQDQRKKFFEAVWGIKSATDKLGVKEKLVKELTKRNFSSKQDEVDFILTFLA